MTDFPDVLADADFIRDWRRDHSMSEVDLGSEYGRLLAERDRLVADGVDPAELARLVPPRLAPSRIRFPLAPLGTCFVCGKREEDQLVDFEGAVRGICSTCYERGQDELPRGDADDEC